MRWILRRRGGCSAGAGAVLATVLALVAGACASGNSGTDALPSVTSAPAATRPAGTSVPAVPAGCAPTQVTRPGGAAGAHAYISNLDTPVALAWAPDGRLFIAERTGTIAIANGTETSTFTTVPTTTTQPGGGTSERGLLGIAISPTFSKDRLVFALYSSADHTSTIVERWTECRGQALDPATIVRLPAGADCCHKGGRLAFGPDAKLYVTIGDEHSVPAPPGGPTPPVPQRTSDPRGKVLRYNANGTIPADNPFGRTSPVWVAGLRNPFGIAFGPDGQVLVTSNGPSGDAGAPGTGFDLALFVRAGTIEQWPYCYGYSHPISPYTSCNDRPEPAWSSENTTVVPTGATWVDAQGPSPYAGHFVFCNNNVGLRVLRSGSPHASVTAGPGECKLDVKQGPDHALYYSDDSTIYRLG
jgi:aldose sugar dehydrogenase